MAEKQMLIIDADVVRKVDENRGEMGRSEFISFLIDSRLKEEAAVQNHAEYVRKEEFYEFAQGIKELLRNSLEFFISYGLELGKQPKDKAFEELTQKIQALQDNSGSKAPKL